MLYSTLDHEIPFSLKYCIGGNIGRGYIWRFARYRHIWRDLIWRFENYYFWYVINTVILCIVCVILI